LTLSRLSAEDARILALEGDTIAGHTCKVLVLDGRVSTDEVRTHVAARIGRAPRLRDRLAPTPLGLAPPVWAPDQGFSVADHVKAVTGDVAEDELAPLAAAAMQRRLPRDRPLWSIDVVERLGASGSALIWLIHHAAADGATCMRLGERVIWSDEDGVPARPPGDDAEPSPAALLRDGLGDRARGIASGAAGAARAVTSPARLRRSAGEVARMPRTVRRELSSSSAPSPFAAEVGRRRAAAFARRPLAELKAVEHAAGPGFTVNDVLLAAVAGGVRRWLEDRGELPLPLRVKIPVSMHPANEQPDALGNRDSFIFVTLPVHEPDPQARLRSINAETTLCKQAHDPSTLYAFFNDLSHVLPPAARAASKLAMSPGTFAFSVSNVRGPANPVSVAGRPLTAMYSLAEIADRHALRLSGLSFAGQMTVGMCADADAVLDLDGLAAGIEQGFDELTGPLET
jgi:diacylglycerol O-acyltransferase / wax synthase